jgi:hypothetical protein
MTKKKNKKLKVGPWTKKEIRTLKRLFPSRSCVEVAERLGRPFYAVKRKSYRMGVYKSKTYLRKIGRT